MFGMDGVVLPLLSTTNQPDPRVLPLMRDSEFWEERILFASDRGGRSWLPCFAPPGEVPAPPNGTNHLSPLAFHLSPVCSRRPALGTAEVRCCHPNRSRTIADLNPREVLEIVEQSTERYRALVELEYVNHIHIFEAEASGPRVAFENSEFMGCLPFFPTDAHEVSILPLRPAPSLAGPEIAEESTTNGSNPDQRTEALRAVSTGAVPGRGGG